MTETELGAAGRTEAKAGGARDGLTDRPTGRASRPQACFSRAGAGGAPAQDGERIREAAAGGMGLRGLRGRELAARAPKGSVSLQSWDRVPKLHAASGSKRAPRPAPPPLPSLS